MNEPSSLLKFRRRVWRIPVYLGFGGVVVTIEPWTWRGIRRRFK